MANIGLSSIGLKSAANDWLPSLSAIIHTWLVSIIEMVQVDWWFKHIWRLNYCKFSGWQKFKKYLINNVKNLHHEFSWVELLVDAEVKILNLIILQTKLKSPPSSCVSWYRYKNYNRLERKENPRKVVEKEKGTLKIRKQSKLFPCFQSIR